MIWPQMTKRPRIDAESTQNLRGSPWGIPLGGPPGGSPPIISPQRERQLRRFCLGVSPLIEFSFRVGWVLSKTKNGVDVLSLELWVIQVFVNLPGVQLTGNRIH